MAKNLLQLLSFSFLSEGEYLHVTGSWLSEPQVLLQFFAGNVNAFIPQKGHSKNAFRALFIW